MLRSLLNVFLSIMETIIYIIHTIPYRACSQYVLVCMIR